MVGRDAQFTTATRRTGASVVVALSGELDMATAPELPEAVSRVLGDAVTTRNWATMTKLQALAGD